MDQLTLQFVCAHALHIVPYSGVRYSLFVNTAAALPPPTILTAIGMTTAIILTWDQPDGSIDAVDRYEIHYNFTINQCPAGQTMQGSINVGRMTTFMLEGGDTTPIEEDSKYFITVTAINQVTNSTSMVKSVTTSTAGWHINSLFLHDNNRCFIAPTGVPQNVQTMSVNATSITIRWDEVLCQYRNGLINAYRVLTSSGINTSVSNRIFTANQLLPRKSYNFSVEALSTSSYNGPPANITVETHVLQGEMLYAPMHNVIF